MRRIYFLLPDIEAARDMVQRFRGDGFTDHRLHLVAWHNVEMDGLPEASFAQYSDVVPALKRGTALGGGAGLLAGLAAVAFPPAGIVAGGGAVAAITAAGAGVGGWAASLVGAGMDRQQIAECEAALRRGAVLMLVDVEKDQVKATREKVQHLYPDTAIADVERIMPIPAAAVDG